MPFKLATSALLLSLALLLTPGCDPADDDDSGAADDDDATVEPDVYVDIDAECENINPLYCMLPWPTSRYLIEDESTATGWTMDYDPEAFPPNNNDDAFILDPYNRMDGFPPSAQIITLFAEPVDGASLPSQFDFGESLLDDSPTVLLNMDTGEKVAHFSEFDVRFDDPEEILMYVRPSQRLAEDTRYAVAIRDLTYESGGAVEASEVFAALRDDLITDEEQVEARRASFEEIFTALDGAGVPRADLIQAWDFRTASGEMLWGDMLHIRDDAMERVGADGIACTVESVIDEYNDEYYREISGTITVPLYMDAVDPPARLVRGPDGMPEYQGDHEVDFVAYIPRSLAEPGAEPGRLMTYGHGFFGDTGECNAGWLRSEAEQYGYVVTGTDWAGMSTGDVAYAAAALVNLSDFPMIPERLMQGVTNFLVLTRTIAGVCADDEAFQVNGHTAFDPDELYYMGMSQGAIMGATTLAMSQDIDRAVLNVGAANYPVMEGRSRNFNEFELIYSAWYEDRIDREFYWSVLGHVWELTDPITYLPHLTTDPLPGSSAKQIIYQVGMNDAQVCNVASDMAARTGGFTQLLPSNHEVWGMDEFAAGDTGVIQYWDCGAPDVPTGNQAPDENESHECVRRRASAQAQVDAFFHPDGEIVSMCDGECDPD
jgi:hypothetical protein